MTTNPAQIRLGVFNYLSSAMRSYLVKEAPDNKGTALMQFAENRRGNVMPPGTLVEGYTLSLESYDWERVISHCENIRWRPHHKMMVDKLPPENVLHRSRGPVISAGFLRGAELLRRIDKVKNHVDDYRRLRLSDSVSHELVTSIHELMLKYIEVDMGWIYDFVVDHESSSIGSGYKWPHTLSMHREDWEVLANLQKEKIEADLAHPDWWNAAPFNYGIRGRAPELQAKDIGASSIVSEFDRSRIVMYHPSMSMLSVLLPRKKEFYNKGFAIARKILGTTVNVVSPYTHGGKLYTEASNEFAKGSTFRAYDGKNWESGMAIILGKYFQTQAYNLAGLPALPSGHGLTSFWNTVATSSVLRGDGTAVISGDDCNVFGNVKVPKGYALEYQKEDTAMKFILGVSYKDDPLAPRITGFKLTMDRADQMKPITIPHSGQSEAILLQRKRSKEQVALHAGMFFGRYGEKSLIESIERVDWGKHYSFGNWLDSLEFAECREPLAWAEELGVKRVFT